MDKMIANRYMIVTSLGEGGMADVYLAMDTILNREVAVKVLRGELSEDPVALLRFLREASAVSKLHHPNVVEVYDVGEYNGKNYIVMEYVRGRTLKQLITQRGALQKEEAVEIMKQLVSAIAHAHENNIIHRDIKPQNVLVKDDGTVKITDFGIALAHDAIQLTQSDAVLGSAHYIAPETTKGETATVQIDIYALGIVFYELLTGTVPFKGDNPIQVAMKHLREDIPSVRKFNPTLPQSIENIIIKATAKNRVCRYATAKDMMYDLEMCLLPEFADVDKVTLVNNEKGSGTVVIDRISDLDENEEVKDATKTTTVKNTKSVKTTKSGKKSIKNDEDKKKKMIIAGIVAVVALSGIGATIALMNHNDKPEEEEVIRYSKMPDLEGMTVEEATEVLKKKKLKLNTKIKEEVTEDVEKGLIIKQSVEKDEKVKQGTKITITISAGMYFEVGNYVGWNIMDAKAELEANGVTVLIEERETNDYPEGQILQQSMLSEGSKIEPGESKKIKFIIAKAKKEEVETFTLSNYVGMDYQYVKGLLEAKGIRTVFEEVDWSEDLEKNGYTPGQIISQNYGQGTVFELSKTNTVTFKYCGQKPVNSGTDGEE